MFRIFSAYNTIPDSGRTPIIYAVSFFCLFPVFQPIILINLTDMEVSPEKKRENLM
jgi:hypothetical protein